MRHLAPGGVGVTKGLRHLMHSMVGRCVWLLSSCVALVACGSDESNVGGFADGNDSGIPGSSGGSNPFGSGGSVTGGGAGGVFGQGGAFGIGGLDGAGGFNPLDDGGVFVPLTCGNGALDAGEECDVQLGGATCATVTMGAMPLGALLCTATCRFDLSGCSTEGGGPGTGGSSGTGGAGTAGSGNAGSGNGGAGSGGLGNAGSAGTGGMGTGGAGTGGAGAP